MFHSRVCRRTETSFYKLQKILSHEPLARLPTNWKNNHKFISSFSKPKHLLILYFATQRKKVTSLYYCVSSVSIVRCRRSLTSFITESFKISDKHWALFEHIFWQFTAKWPCRCVARSLCKIEQEKQDSIFSHNQSVQFETTKPGDEMVGDEVAWGRSDCNSRLRLRQASFHRSHKRRSHKRNRKKMKPFWLRFSIFTRSEALWPRLRLRLRVRPRR